MVVVGKNRYLTLAEMTENAEYIYSYFSALGWSKQAICGMLGNMQTESSINPSIWQSLKSGNLKGGFGLVQWTPATKYIDWCRNRGIPYTSINSNLARIVYEVENNLQWINANMTFREFTISEDSPYNLGLLFLKYYERPREPNQPKRGAQAEYWYSVLVGGTPIDSDVGGVDRVPNKKSKVYMYTKKRSRFV